MKPEEANTLYYAERLKLNFTTRGEQLDTYFICPTRSSQVVLIAVFKNEWSLLAVKRPLHKLRPIEEFGIYVTDELMRDVNSHFSPRHWAFTVIKIDDIEKANFVSMGDKSLDNILTELENEIK